MSNITYSCLSDHQKTDPSNCAILRWARSNSFGQSARARGSTLHYFTLHIPIPTILYLYRVAQLPQRNRIIVHYATNANGQFPGLLDHLTQLQLGSPRRTDWLLVAQLTLTSDELSQSSARPRADSIRPLPILSDPSRFDPIRLSARRHSRFCLWTTRIQKYSMYNTCLCIRNAGIKYNRIRAA